jgi:hypothetical protein
VQSYLFKTSDENMARYKEAARVAGTSFAEWLRNAAEALTDQPQQVTMNEILELHDGAGRPLVTDSVTEHAADGPISLPDSGKRSYEPDPKVRKKP